MSTTQTKAAGTRKRAPYGSSSNTRSLRKADTMRRLLDAGRALFNEWGYEATTIDQIASAAGVSRAAFYLHFETKADLIRAMVGSVSKALTTGYAKLGKIGPSPSLEAVAEWVRQFMVICHENGATVLLLQRTVQPNGELFNEIDYYDEIIDIFALTYPRFEAARTDPATRAEALLFFLQLEVLIRQMFAAGDRFDWPEVYKVVARHFLTFIHGGQAPAA